MTEKPGVYRVGNVVHLSNTPRISVDGEGPLPYLVPDSSTSSTTQPDLPPPEAPQDSSEDAE